MAFTDIPRLGTCFGQELGLFLSRTSSRSPCLRRHQIGAHFAGRAGDGLKVGRPFAKIFLCIVQDLASLCTMLKSRASITWHDGSVIKQVQESTTMASEHDLLLGTLDGGGEVEIVGILELLARLYKAICQRSLLIS